MLITQETILIAKTTSATHNRQPMANKFGTFLYGSGTMSSSILKLISRALR